jgi:hypothetical protein
MPAPLAAEVPIAAEVPPPAEVPLQPPCGLSHSTPHHPIDPIESIQEPPMPNQAASPNPSPHPNPNPSPTRAATRPSPRKISPRPPFHAPPTADSPPPSSLTRPKSLP